MIRIKANRCGYDQYKCKGIPQIGEDSNGMFDTNVSIVASMKAEFNKLPIRIKGMVFSEDTTNMSWPDGGPHPEVAEISCRTDTDPWSDSEDVSVWNDTDRPLCVAIGGHTYQYPVYSGNSGWTDLYNAEDGDSENPRYFYRNTVVGSTNAVASDVYIIADGHHWHNIYKVGTSFGSYNGIPDFTSDINDVLEDSIEMGPGLLEPMLDTEFDPVNIDVIPAWEAGDDGLILSNILLNDWKDIIDDKLNNLYKAVNIGPIGGDDTNLRNLKAAEYTESECDNFQIVLTSGAAVKGGSVSVTNHTSNTVPDSTIAVGERIGRETITDMWTTVINGSTIWHWTTEAGPNIYSISGGTVKYGDKTITVSGVSNVYPPFYAYLSITEDTSVSYTDVDAQDVPDGSGPDGKIQDGDVLPSGGTITGFTSSVISGRTVYSWSTVGDTTGSVVVLSGSSLPPTQVADPPPGCPGIGGVRVISGGSGNGAYTLYKIYHEDCLSEVDDGKGEGNADDAIVGCIRIFEGTESLVAVEGETESPSAGIVQPVHNILVKSTYPVSSVDVPTVEAVYDFIHGYNTYGWGVANALATEKEVTNVEGTTAYSSAQPGTVITIQKDRALQNTSDTLDALSTAYRNLLTAELAKETAEGIRDDTKAAWELELLKPPEDRDQSKYTAYMIAQEQYEAARAGFISASVAYSTASANCYGAVSDGEQGVVFTIDNIVVSQGHILGESGYTVPTVWGVYTFVHDIYALATVGTVVIDNDTYSKSEGTPGTVFTIDTINSKAFADGKYLEDEVPTVKAVVDYIAGLTGTSAAIPAAIYGGTEYVNIEGSTEHNAGIVQPVVNIYVAGTVPTDLSEIAVPTVKAIHEYIHCTGSSNYDWSSSLATTGTMGSTVSVPATTAGVDGATETAPAIYGSTVKGAVPGTVIVVENIDLSGENVDLDIVPTVLAVVDYIDGLVPVQGYIEVSGGSETWRQGSDDPEPMEGLVFVAKNIDAGTAGVAHEAVPTVAAVKTYVDSVTGATTAVAGKIIESGSPATQSVADVASGITHTVGVVQPVRNIFIGANGTVAQETVPTVDAIYNFVHDIEVSGMSFATARASIGAMGSTVSVPATTAGVNGDTVTTPAVYGSTITDAESGTVIVVGNIDISGNDVPTDIVPTVLAVTGYIDTLVPVAGTISVANGMESWVDASIVRKGLVYTSTNVDAGTAGIAHEAVPTVAAVKAYVDGYVPAEAVPEVLGQDGNFPTTGSTASPGVVYVASTLVSGDTDSDAEYAVPTVNAVAGFVSGYLAVSGELDESTGNWVSGSANSPGIVDVATNVVLGSTGSNAASAVPTVRAVAEYVATHGGGYTGAFAGTKNANGTVNIGPGHAYFGGTTWSFAGASNLSLADGATKFAECAKGTSTITLRDTNTTDLTKATFPLVGKDSSGNLIQCQYGDINIVGRWM